MIYISVLFLMELFFCLSCLHAKLIGPEQTDLENRGVNPHTTITQRPIEEWNRSFIDFCKKPFWQDMSDVAAVRVYLRHVTDPTIIKDAFLAFCKGTIGKEVGSQVCHEFLESWAPSSFVIRDVLAIPYIIKTARHFVPAVFLLGKYPAAFQSLLREGEFERLKSTFNDQPYFIGQIDYFVTLIPK